MFPRVMMTKQLRNMWFLSVPRRRYGQLTQAIFPAAIARIQLLKLMLNGSNVLFLDSKPTISISRPASTGRRAERLHGGTMLIARDHISQTAYADRIAHHG
ncbi:MAG: hypothetical protein R2912_10445 [Eubacteriales bacterium]